MSPAKGHQRCSEWSLWRQENCVCSGWRSLSRHLFAVFSFLMGDCIKKIQLDCIWKYMVTEWETQDIFVSFFFFFFQKNFLRVVKCWNKLFKVVVKYPSLKILKASLDRFLSLAQFYPSLSRGIGPNDHQRPFSNYDFLLLIYMILAFGIFMHNSCNFCFCSYMETMYFLTQNGCLNNQLMLWDFS